LNDFLPTDEATVAVLRERARRLAETPDDDGMGTDSVEVVIFALGVERYAFETKFVRESSPLKTLTPLPGVPAFIAGIANLRSEIVSVVNLAAVLNVSAEKPARSFVLYLQDKAMAFGVMVDAVAGVRDISLADLHTCGASFSAIPQRYLRGLTTDGVAVLDAHAMLSDERLVVRN